MANTSDRSSAPPVWSIKACKWLWRMQGYFWRTVFGAFLIELLLNIIFNVVANVALVPQPLSVLRQAIIIDWIARNMNLALTTLAIILAIEIIIYFGSHVHLETIAVTPIPSAIVPTPQTLPPAWRKMLRLLLPVLMILNVLLIVGVALWHRPPPLPITGIGIVQVNGDQVGVCDGSCFFDIMRINHTLKSEAAASFSAGHLENAYQYWKWATDEDITDAEAKIFLEDMNILRSGQPRMTLVATISLSKNVRNATNVACEDDMSATNVACEDNMSATNASRDMLQGIYVQQKEYNDAHPKGPLVYLLIANLGPIEQSNANLVQQQVVADQISQVAHADSTFAGVTGLPFGSDGLINALSQRYIPMVSIASTVTSTTKKPYFLSVAPSLQDEAQAAVSYINNTLHAMHVLVASESGDLYSTALKDAFVDAFQSTLAGTVSYPGGSVSDLNGIASQAVSSGADLIYFTGSPTDASVLLAQLHSMKLSLSVMGGNTIYQFVHSSPTDRVNFNGLLFSAFAFPDEPSIQHIQPPSLIADYAKDFDSDQKHVGNPYTYSRANSDAILSYDALSLLTSAGDLALYKEKLTLTPKIMWNALEQFTTNNMLQGVSGQISFSDMNSSPYQKSILILSIQAGGTQSTAVQTGFYRCTSCYKEASQ